jgi:hypothetical protein
MRTKPLARWDVKTGIGSKFQYYLIYERDGVDDPRLVEVLAVGMEQSEWLSEVLLTSRDVCFGCSLPRDLAESDDEGIAISLVLRCRRGHRWQRSTARAGAGSAWAGALAILFGTLHDRTFRTFEFLRLGEDQGEGVDS